MCLDFSPLLSPVRDYFYVLPTRLMNHSACKSRPLNCRKSVSIAQLVELASDVFEIFLPNTSAAHPASRQSGHDASTPETSSDTVGVGEQAEGVSGRGAILIASQHGKTSKIRLRKAEEPSLSSSYNFVRVIIMAISCEHRIWIRK